MKKSIFIINFLSIFIIVMIIEIITSSNNAKNESTFESYGTSKIINVNLDSDNKEDILYISSLNNNYSIQISNSFGSFYLCPERNISTLGDVNSHWPLHVTLKDISGDSIPEIFIQSSHENISLINIYKWCDNNYKRIYTGNENILAFLETSVAKIPYLIMGNYVDGTTSIKNFFSVNNSLIEFNDISVNILLKDTEFNSIISNQNTTNCLNNNNSYENIAKYTSNFNSTLKFQDSIFHLKSDEFKINPINWSLNYSMYQNNNHPQLLNVIITSNQKFKIHPQF